MNLLEYLKRIYKKNSFFLIILVCLALIYIIINVLNDFSPKIEGFSQNEKFILKTNKDINDAFYSDIYDDLHYKKSKNDFHVNKAIYHSNDNDIILNVGCKTGRVAGELSNESNYTVYAIDESSEMIALGKNKYPNVKFSVGSPLKTMLFSENTFNQILALNFTIYYFKDKRTFLQNCYHWLQPNGYLIIQLINKSLFDPVIPASNPFYLVNPQTFAEKRITTSSVKFNNFNYNADFKIYPNDLATFKEVFKFKDGKIRQHEQKLYMPSPNKIVAMSQEVGFIVNAKYDLIECAEAYQYLYVLQKPN
jgi:ubiquinone/menaquinone biosynthesis C-methylase UbiE